MVVMAMTVGRANPGDNSMCRQTARGRPNHRHLALTYQPAMTNLARMTADSADLSLGESAYQRLREEIVTCRLLPGHRLTERRLSADLGLGMSPVREALTRLDHEGLVVTLPRKGYQVAPLTLRAIDELFDFFEFVGPEIARRGVEKATDEQLVAIRNGYESIRELRNQGVPDAAAANALVSTANSTFLTLATATGNSYLAKVMEQMAMEVARVYRLILISDAASRVSLLTHASHAEMPSAAESRDGEKLAELTRQFIRHSHNEILRVLVSWPSVRATEVVLP